MILISNDNAFEHCIHLDDHLCRPELVDCFDEILFLLGTVLVNQEETKGSKVHSEHLNHGCLALCTKESPRKLGKMWELI